MEVSLKKNRKYTINDLKEMRNMVQTFQENEHIEILNIIKKDGIRYTENKNGIFINMRKLNNSTLERINDFIIFCQKNTNFLAEDHLIRSSFNDLFNNDLNKN